MLPIPQIRSRELYPEMKCGADGGICEAFWKIQRNGLQQQIIFLLQSPDRMNPNSVPYVVMGIQDIDIFPSP
jgi:hypothetical protein